MLAGQKCRAQLLVYLPGTPEKMLLKSKAIEMEAGSGKGPKKEIAGGQEEGETITDLVGQFRKDAFAAPAAHAKAVKRGAEMVQPLAEAMKDKSLPDFARMWMATSIIDIGGEGAFDIIIKLVEDQSSGVRNVVAYYGPRLQQEKIDQAIYARADKGEDPLFTAWAARGFATFTKQFPRRLVNAAYASTDPRARAQVADALALSKDAADYLRLAKLFSDENEPVRVSAADAVKQHKIKDSMMLGAMVNSLKLPGEAARERVVDTLAGLTGKTWDYNPDATKEKREKVLREIELWWQLSGGAK